MQTGRSFIGGKAIRRAKRVGWRAHHSTRRITMVGTAQERLCPPYELEGADGKIAQPQIGVAAFFPEPEQRPVQRLPQQVVALAHRDPDPLAEIPAFDE